MRHSIFSVVAFVLLGFVFLPFPLAQGQLSVRAQAHLEFGLKAYRDEFFEPAIDSFRAYLKRAGGSPEAPRVHYLLAEALRRDDRLKEAIAAYQLFLERYPGHERADAVRFRVGELSERSGNRQEAISAYASVQPGIYRTEAVYRIAALRLAARAWTGAVGALDEFIESAPKDPRVENALFERAVALERIPRMRAAERAYALAIRRFPQNPRSHAFAVRLAKIQLRLKKFAESEKTLDSLFRQHPEDAKRAGLKLGQATSFFAQQKYAKASEAFEAALGMDLAKSQRMMAERGLAFSWWHAGKYARAAKAYQRLIREPAKDGSYLLYFLQSVKKAGACREGGKEYLIFALDVIGKGALLPASARFQMADCLFDAGLRKEAVTQYHELIRRAPNAREAVWSELRLVGMLEEDEERNREEILKRYGRIWESFNGLRKSAGSVDPELAQSVYQGILRAASLHSARKDCAQAVRLVKTVPNEYVPEPLRAEVAFLRAECAWEKEKLDEAEHYFSQVIAGANRPALAARARYRLGEAAQRRGDRKEALKRFQGALPFLSEEFKREARLKIGGLYREEGDFQKARAFLLPLANDAKVSDARRRSIWYFLARNSARESDWKSADEALSSWDALMPLESAEGLRLWAFVLFQRKDCGSAVKISGRALELTSLKNERLALYRLRASCFFQVKDLKEFSRALRQVLTLDPRDAEAAFGLGEVFENMGDFDQAARAYARFLSEFPQNRRADAVALRLGMLEMTRERPEEAEAAFRAASKSSDARISGPALFQIAAQLERDGKRSEALEIFESLLRPGMGCGEWLRSAAWRAAAIRESRKEWGRAVRYYQSILALEKPGVSLRIKEEIKQAKMRIRQLESYLAAVKEREFKMKNRELLLR